MLPILTFSIGLGVFARVPDSGDEIIAFADSLMYRAKASGKNDVLTEAFAAPRPLHRVSTS